MNASSLYVSACRLIMQNPGDDNSSLVDLNKAFPSLRQALSCTVCGNLLIEPYTPTESNCQHHVCRSCRGERKKLKPSCSWCKDYSKYYENVHLRTLLQCYKKLCIYVTNSYLFRDLLTLSTSTCNNNILENSKTLVDIIKEGAGFKDDFSSSNLKAMPYSQNIFCDATTQTESSSPDSSKQTSNDNNKSVSTNGIYSCTYTGTGNRLTIKRESESPTLDEKMSRLNKLRKKSAFGLMVTSCHCGLQVNPSRVTCRGYKCPCYSHDRPCIDCACHSCNNPIGVNPRDCWDDYVAENKTAAVNKLTPIDPTKSSEPVVLNNATS